MLKLNSWAVLAFFILNWTTHVDSIGIFNQFSKLTKFKNKYEEKKNETDCRLAYFKATENLNISNEHTSFKNQLKEYSNLIEYSFFRRNEHCFYFTIIQEKTNPCGADGISTLFYLNGSREDSYLEEFVNKTLENRRKIPKNIASLKNIDTSINNFVFGLYYIKDLENGIKLIWRNENDQTIEISENVSKYLNIQSYSRVEQDQYVRFNYRNGTRSTGYDSNYKNVYDSCYGNDECGSHGECVNHFPEKKFTCKCRSFYDGKYCEKWSNNGKQMVICIILIISTFLLTFVYKILSYLIRKIKSEKADATDKTHMFYQEKIKYNFKGFKLNLMHNMLKFSKKYAKLIIMTAISLAVSISLILTSKNSLFDIFKMNAKFCKVKESYTEDYIFVLIAFPLTAVLYIVNALGTKTIHLSTCRFTIYLKGLSEKRRSHSSDTQTSKLNAVKLYFMRFFLCSCSFVLPVPMNPFSKKNRLITILIFVAYFYNITKILESVSQLPSGVNLTYSDNCTRFFQEIGGHFDNFSDKLISFKEKILNNLNSTTEIMSTTQTTLLFDQISSTNSTPTELESFIDSLFGELNKFQSNSAGGILLKLLITICNVLILGFAFYPILLCIEFKSKSLINYALCSGYMWLMLWVNFYLDSFCENKRTSFLKFLFTLIKCGLNKIISASELLETNLNATNSYMDDLKPTNINIKLEKYFFYLSLCLLASLLTTNTIFLFIDYVARLFSFGDHSNSIVECNREMEFTAGYIKNEIKYTRGLLIETKSRPSFFRYLFEKYIYKSQPNYRYSKQLLSTCVFSLILIYYLTTNLVNTGNEIAKILKKVVFFMALLVMRIFVYDEKKLYEYMSKFNEAIESTLLDVFYQSCFLTGFIYAIQALLIVKNYHKHILNAYKNVFVDIPPPKAFSNLKLVSASMHYSGYAIGYLLWGYSLSFMVMIILVGTAHVLFKVLEFMEGFVVILLPPLAIFIFRRFLLWYSSKFFLTNNQNKNLRLRNRRYFLLLNHFNFFFDLFLITFLCFLRVVKSAVTAAFYMPRLDYSIFGRYLEKSDMGFCSLVCFLHVEVNQTHPVKLSFLKYLLRRLYDHDLHTKTKAQLQARNKWFLAYTLSQNPSLKKLRKNHIIKEKYTNPERETFGHFVSRNFNQYFGGLIRSKPSLNRKISNSKINIVEPVEMRSISKKPDNFEILRLSSIQPIQMDNFEITSIQSSPNLDDSFDAIHENKEQ